MLDVGSGGGNASFATVFPGGHAWGKKWGKKPHRFQPIST